MTSEFNEKIPSPSVKDNQNSRRRELLRITVPIAAIPLVIALGVLIPGGRGYNLVSIVTAILSSLPALIAFERGEHDAREMTALAVMSAMSILSRIIFAPLPGFKPVAALVIITGISFGAEAGFITGSMTAIVSNVYFGQGMWTPFQMLAWGLIGFISGGVLHKSRLRLNKIILSTVGILGGVLFSLLMDIWTTLSFDGGFSFRRYLFFIAEGLPFMVLYAASNVILLLLLAPPLCRKLDRLRIKYGIFK